MPLVRAEVRNEYGLGAPEMYLAANDDEPKEILEGVAVAGLVGILRQLGDLSDFAAEVFHGLQEEVMITYSRSRKLMSRVQQIEAALAPVEKAALAQRSHLHFSYTAGTNWHAHTRCEKNHFVYSDMPQFILDSYEDCRGPPQFHLLDRFDPGGPGSCLKRYSDPTIFKKTSAESGEASPEKVSKYEKGHKIKKRSLWPRNGEVSRGTSSSYESGRNVGEYILPCQPISIDDARLRADLSEQSTLDWRNGSGPSFSMQRKEQEYRDVISYPQKSQGSDYLDQNFLKEKVTDACDDIQINLTQEQGVCSSYSDTQGGKTAIFEPAMQDYDHDGLTLEDDHDRSPESFFPRLDLETMGDNAVNLETVDRLDVQTCNQTLEDFRPGAIQLDDFENETDHFTDALNTIEQECEIDLIYMRKQDVDHFSKLEEKAADDGVPELIKHNSECQTSSSEFNISADGSLMKGGRVRAKDAYHSVSSMDEALLSAQRTGNFLNPGNPQSTSCSGNGEINNSVNVESVSCTVSSTFRDDGSLMSITGNTLRSQECEKPSSEASTVASVNFWTNGGLLRVQPSKPPDCNVLNDLPRDHISKKDGKIRSSSQHLIISDKDPQKTGKTDSFENIEMCLDMDSSTCQEYDSLLQSPSSSPPLARMKISVQPIDRFKTSKLRLSLCSGDINDESGRDIFPSFQLVPEVSITQHDVGSDSDDDTFSRSPSLSDNHHSIQSESNYEQWEIGRSPSDKDPDLCDSLSKISFTQSVPTVLENGMSQMTCHGGYHESCGIQFPSVENSTQASHSCQFDLQSTEMMNQSFQEKLRNDTNSKDLMEPVFTTAPDPPPLPPVQWRGMKPHLDDTECSSNVRPKGLNYAFDLKDSASAFWQQPKPACLNHDQILETTNVQKSKPFGSQKSSEQREANQGITIDENDFLHQIRTKSFSLRPTVPAKPTIPSGSSSDVQVSAILEKANAIRQATLSSSSNVQVTAILEKANAIRQAVESDDGDDDDSWSDS